MAQTLQQHQSLSSSIPSNENVRKDVGVGSAATSTSADEVREGLEKVAGGGGEDPEKPVIDPSEGFPDGGLQAWLCVFGGFCCLMCSFGWINCVGIFQAYYQQNQLKKYSSSAVSWITSLESFCMFAAASIIGKYFDAYGPRVILLVGTFLHVFGLMMASISTDLWHFILSQGLISATGASMIFTPALSSVSTWFFYRRAFVLGITAAGSSIGGVVFPIMIRRLIVLVGFGWSMRITAFVILFLMVLANLTVRSRLPTKTFIPLSIRDFTKPFAEIPFSLTVVAAFLFFFGMFLPFNYLPLFGLSRGMSASMSNYLISILNAASVFGRIIPGYISDKVGRFNMTTIITLVSGLSVLAMWIPANNSGSALTIVFSGVYGFTTGAFVSLGPALIAQISDIKEIGVRTGAMYAVVSIGVLTGSPIGGALLSSRGWLGMEVFSGVVLVAGGIIFVLARLSLVGTRIRAVV